MTDSRHALVSKLFAAVVELQPDRRAEFLASECGGDAELRIEVEALLANDKGDFYLDRPVWGLDAEDARSSLLGSSHAALLARLAERAAGGQRYQVGDEIARGGMGRILAALDTDLRRRLAMKVLHRGPGEEPSSGADPFQLSRFLEEAQITGQLNHPGVVPVHDLGLDADGRIFFTMRLVEGDDLGLILRKTKAGDDGWNVVRAVGVIQKVCETMAFAHDKRVLHRDLKPANVMVGSFGEVYVMDWGVARVEGEQDRCDLRLQAGPEPRGSKSVRTERTDARDSNPESPLLTMDGTVVGTPYYMPPEQALGRVEDIGPAADVYAVGAMLYQLLVGHAPYSERGEVASPYAVLARVQNKPPLSIDRLAPNVPDRLRAICNKAMARRPQDRYGSMLELADDLRAYLENRVVRAHATGALAEAVMWVRRNRKFALALAVAFLLLASGVVATSLQKQRADEKAQGVLRLSTFRTIEELSERADNLWPIQPDQARNYRAWLADAEELLASLERAEDGGPGLRSQLADLRARAAGVDTNDAESNLRGRELALKKEMLASLRRAQAVREGTARVEEVSLGPAWNERSPADLCREAEWRVYPGERLDFGHEAEGLALARLALRRAKAEQPEDSRLLYACRLALAHALLTNGLDGELGRADWLEAPSAHRALIDFSGGVPQRSIGDLEHEVARLEKEHASRAALVFESQQQGWWYDQLALLVPTIENFSGNGLIDGFSEEHSRGVRWRLGRIEDIRERSLTGGEAEHLWRDAIAKIQAHPRYAGLVLEPIFGLLPIGVDPDSGLWEFVHLLTGDAPGRSPDGHLIRHESMGIVLVLVPGGRFIMGIQSGSDKEPGYDRYAPPTGVEHGTHEVRCSPFLIGKFEVTQAQWLRFTGTNPSELPYTDIKPGWNKHGRESDGTHPVETVSWNAAARVARQMGLRLPTEAQWEYAARAGTTTSWWTGNDRRQLEGAENLADEYEARKKWERRIESWNDGELISAPVGTFRANPFGLHDVLGNVHEWCFDGWSFIYQFSLPDDPVFPPWRSPQRVLRGGSFEKSALSARSSSRDLHYPVTAEFAIGLRLARGLEDPPEDPLQAR